MFFGCALKKEGNKMRTIITYRTIKLALALLGFITAQLYMDPAVMEAATPKPISIKIATLAPSGSLIWY